MKLESIQGCLFGMAFGDSLGADTEFLNIIGIQQRFPPNGPTEIYGHPALVTDDTQMALAVGEALLEAPQPYQPDSFGHVLRDKFVQWYNSPDNNRAPGNTCLSACKELIEGKKWLDSSKASSKGCGANMRVMPVGLLNVDAKTRAQIAQLQAAYTHGHPTGLAAADLTAFVIADLANGGKPNELLNRIRHYAESQSEVYHKEWLGELWMKPIVFKTPQEYIQYGWKECLSALSQVEDALMVSVDTITDPCLHTGAGWIAEGAFATALFCFLLYADNPSAVIQRAACTSGDSDSIACIAGAFAGAYCDIQSWESDWIYQIEYENRISHLAEKLHQQHKSESIL